MGREGFHFCIPSWMREDKTLFVSVLELIIVTLKAPHLSVKGANKRGYHKLSCSNHNKHIVELGKMFINGKISLKDFLLNLRSDTHISDATLIKRRGKRVYGAKKIKNYVSGAYEVSQDLLLTTNRCEGGRNFISTFKIINHNKRHATKPQELAKLIGSGEIKKGDWYVYDGGLKSGKNVQEGRRAGVNVVTRLDSNFVVKLIGREYRKEDILSKIKPFTRTIDGVSFTIFVLKRCIWQNTAGNLLLIRGEKYDDFIPLFTTALNSKPETVISKYKERSSIEQVIKELKSYLKIEGNYFRTKESNYGFIFLACMVYNFVQYISTQLHDMSFKDVLESLSAYLIWADPPECVLIHGETFEELLKDIGYELPNRMNIELVRVLTPTNEVSAGEVEKKLC